jgi:hypothetical protein
MLPDMTLGREAQNKVFASLALLSLVANSYRRHFGRLCVQCNSHTRDVNCGSSTFDEKSLWSSPAIGPASLSTR